MKRQLFLLNPSKRCLKENILGFHHTEKQRVIAVTSGTSTRSSTQKVIILQTGNILLFVEL